VRHRKQVALQQLLPVTLELAGRRIELQQPVDGLGSPFGCFRYRRFLGPAPVQLRMLDVLFQFSVYLSAIPLSRMASRFSAF
jgi:hypothetical protein